MRGSDGERSGRRFGDGEEQRWDDERWDEGGGAKLGIDHPDVFDPNSENPYGGLTMKELLVHVVQSESVIPMRVPKLSGLAKLLRPEEAEAPPRYDWHRPFGLSYASFEPPNSTGRPGHLKPASVDRLLSTAEEHPWVLPPVPALSTAEEWYEALMLPEEARMRRNPRFQRIIREYSHPSKYTPHQKQKMLYALQFGLACDPKRAGFKDGKAPYQVEGFAPEEMPGYEPPPGYQPPDDNAPVARPPYEAAPNYNRFHVPW